MYRMRYRLLANKITEGCRPSGMVRLWHQRPAASLEAGQLEPVVVQVIRQVVEHVRHGHPTCEGMLEDSAAELSGVQGLQDGA
jgi:hypothetical protein